MRHYIATFYSHFGALSYYKALKAQGVSAKLAPVPRKVSSSCGTCCSYEHESFIDMRNCELDGIYIDGTFECVLKK